MAKSTSTRITGRPRHRFYHWHLCRFEMLEVRQVLTAGSSLIATPDVIVLPNAKPNAGGGIAGFSPAQIQQAYGFDQVSFSQRAAGSSTTTTYSEANNNLGQGQTVAIIDAFSNPTIFADANMFSATFGLPQFVTTPTAAGKPYSPALTIVNQTGTKNLPSPNQGWAGEITLDVEWVHAIAPGANILLVECNDLVSGIDYARHQPGVCAISCSFGIGAGFITPTFSTIIEGQAKI